MKRLVLRLLVFLVGLVPLLGSAKDEGRWSKEVVEVFETLPVQSGGRVMPLDTFARTQLLKLRGTRTARNADGEKVPAVEWLLDVLFYPEAAKKEKVFIVDDAKVVTAMELDLDEIEAARNAGAEDGKIEKVGRRGRFSYDELAPGRDKLMEEWAAVEKIDENSRSAFHTQVATLGQQMREFEGLVEFLDFARAEYPLENGEKVGVMGLFEQDDLLPRIGADYPLVLNGQPPVMPASEVFYPAARSGMTLYLFPAEKRDDPTWLSPGQTLFGSVQDPEFRVWGLKQISMLAGMVEARGDSAVLLDRVKTMHDRVTIRAKERGELGKVNLEVRLNRLQPFYQALKLFIYAALAIALSWLSPSTGFGKWSKRIATILTWVGLGMVVAGIVMRMFIRGLEEGMGPITNLYETIIFIAGFMVLLCFVTEKLTKRGIALAMAPAIGALGMFISILYEIGDGGDTLGRLPAVLITNFWLAVHVPTVNVGYAGCMLASLMSWVYIIRRSFDVGRKKKDFFQSLTRMTYGALCFGMVTSLVGTVLGGIWANDSWGRFWGWDPKENGALMIVLWSLAMLHARMGGYIKEFGLHLWSVVMGMIVAFSWFHVNVLGVGLHSYGFTKGVKVGVMVFYGIAGVVLVFGLVVWAIARSKDGGRRGNRMLAEGEAPPGRMATSES
ncbi:MAG: cytochrome c biogenesis protein CcsA [Verrucomicrobiales bacterium]|nr:cytochrome c biogenesis protein CcsA [Verrucomicrobiales bacterium]